MDSHRTERVSEALREELAEMIAYELSDPRIGVFKRWRVRATSYAASLLTG
jgi:ribosome-binding factor A